jgi:hypothetical protein
MLRKGNPSKHLIPAIIALSLAMPLLFLRPSFNATIFAVIISAFILLKYPEFGLVFYTTSLGLLDPLAEAVGIPEGLRAFPLAIMIAVSLAIHLIREKKWIGVRRVYLLPLSFLFLLIVGLLWTEATGYGLHKVQAFVLYNMLAFFGVAVFAGEEERLRRMVSAGVYLGLIFCAKNMHKAWKEFIRIRKRNGASFSLKVYLYHCWALAKQIFLVTPLIKIRLGRTFVNFMRAKNIRRAL